MPTFRDSALSWIEGSGLDFDKLNIKLQQINTTLWLKLHPLDVSNSIKPLAFSNIKILSGNIDMYPLLKSFDALVTDYSSIYFDYLLLNRPTIFFAYDLENYLSVDRDMYFDYDEMTPGPIIKTQSELEQEIISIAKSKDEYASERQKIRNRVYDYRGGEASEHIFRELESRYLH
jgi:CDP-glycerol glycerophosphotransferase (TagB/SpsB family)